MHAAAAPHRAIRAAFLSTLLGVGVAHAWSPAWAEALRAEGYYVDLVAQLLDQGTQVIAGGAGTLRTRVANQGPDTASAPLLHAAAPADVVLLAADCNGTSGRLSCALAPLADGEQHLVHIAVAPAPHVRGIVAIGAHVQSGEDDADEGNNLAVTWMEVAGVHDIAGHLLDEVPQRRAGGGLRWVARFHNDGPSTVLDAATNLYVHHGHGPLPQIACSAHGGAACPTDTSLGQLPPGSWLEVTVDTGELASADDVIFIYGYLSYADGEDRGTREDWLQMSYHGRIFSDRFGDW